MALLETSYNDYYTIHCLVVEYKNGNKKSGEILLEKFYNFLCGYSTLFKTGTADVNNPSLKAFVKYFSQNKNITHLMYLNRYKTNDISKSVNVINFKLMTSTMSYDEFNQELYVAFFTMVNRYNDTKPSFHTYITKTFHYVLLERLKPIFKNCLINSNIIDYYDNKNLIDEHFSVNFDMFIENLSYEIENYSKILKVKHYSIYSNDFFNDNWILGNYSDSYFKAFSNFEREIIKLNYIENKSDRAISKDYGLCSMTIFRKRNKIVSKLKEIYLHTLH